MTNIHTSVNRISSAIKAILNISGSKGLIKDAAGGQLTNGRTSTATVVDFEGFVIDCKPNEIRFSDARRVDHFDDQMYNAGVIGVEYFDTETDGVTPLAPKPTILAEGPAINLARFATEPALWLKQGAATALSVTGVVWSNMVETAVTSGGASWNRVVTRDNVNLLANDIMSISFIYKLGTSNDYRVEVRNIDESKSSVAYLITNKLEDAGAIALISDEALSGDVREIKIRFTALLGGAFSFSIGPNSSVAGEDILVYSGSILKSPFHSSFIRTDAAVAPRSADNIKIPVQAGSNFYQDAGVLIMRYRAKYDSITQNFGLFAVQDSYFSVLFANSLKLRSSDSSSGISTADIPYPSEIIAVVIWDDIESIVSVNYSVDQGASWSTWVQMVYDGAFTVGGDIKLFLNNPFVNELVSLKIFNELVGGSVLHAQAWAEINSGNLTS